MNQKGFVPLYILVGILIIGLSGVLIYFKQAPAKKTSETSSNDQNQATPSALPTTKASASLSPAKSLTPKASSLSPRLSPSPTPTVVPTPVQVSTTKKNTCEVNVIYGKMGGGSSDPLMVTLTYSYSGYNNTYMTGAQWDFDGDGNWDTDMKQSNGTVEHTYGSGGNYNIKLKLQASDGSTTDICSKTASLAGAIEVLLKGVVYNDLNCNNSKDDGENGVSGATLAIMTPGGLVYETVTTDANGSYSFSKKITVGESITVEPSPNIHNGIRYYPTAVTLNSQNSMATTNISVCP